MKTFGFVGVQVESRSSKMIEMAGIADIPAACDGKRGYSQKEG
jgi:hypothetical protein